MLKRGLWNIRSLILVLLLGTAVPVVIAPVTGCKTTEKRALYNTLYSTETTVVNAYDAYLYAVVKGGVSTNDVPKVSKAFNRYQLSMSAAVAAAQYNWEAPTPEGVATLAAEVLATIQLATKGR